MNFFTFFKMDQEQKVVTYITLNLASLNVQILFETLFDRFIMYIEQNTLKINSNNPSRGPRSLIDHPPLVMYTYIISKTNEISNYHTTNKGTNCMSFIFK